MVMARAGLAFFLDVPHFTAGRDLAVAANHTSAVQRRESQKSHETHTYPLGGLVMASLVAFQPATLLLAQQGVCRRAQAIPETDRRVRCTPLRDEFRDRSKKHRREF
jgi:hypothetical protein